MSNKNSGILHFCASVRYTEVIISNIVTLFSAKLSLFRLTFSGDNQTPVKKKIAVVVNIFSTCEHIR
jgi:hypothetical protein